MKIRKWVIIIHRDLGYFLVGLVVLYSISGLAVNHIQDWNPNYTTEVGSFELGPLDSSDLDALEAEVVARLAIDPREVQGRFRPVPERFKLFLPDGGEVELLTTTGVGTITRLDRRPVLFESNLLHLNTLKGWWTWVADAFAVGLIVLAITGMFILKGRKGLGGRGKWFVAAGFLLPLAFLVAYEMGL